MSDGEEIELDLRTRLNLETGQITWKEIEGFFARGQAMYVSADLDLVEVAALTAEDNNAVIEPWIQRGQLGPLTVEQAKDWQSRNPELWAVVVAPWVFVQEKSD